MQALRDPASAHLSEDAVTRARESVLWDSDVVGGRIDDSRAGTRMA